MSNINGNESSFVGYDYKDLTVKREMASVYADGYANFGWTLEGQNMPGHGIGDVTLKFKRDRKIKNKAELTRLQRQFDACAEEIVTLERSKTTMASVTAYTIGIIGTAFMAGSVFSFTASLLISSIVLAVPGFLCWIIPYFAYRKIQKDRGAKVLPIIDQKHDEIYTVCEKANGLLDT